ncbi:hypothetical protein F4778DRAFT_714157 [Xylariomycetidae sp. FL2044]|nr:hypothetical protein F4778DRAFT_714157 [Xylariomycetidae sp. FL2044]
MERTAQKVTKSKGQARTIQSRRKTWDDINKDVPTPASKPTTPTMEDADTHTREEAEWEDADMGEAEDGSGADGGAQAMAEETAMPSAPNMEEDDDGIL